MNKRIIELNELQMYVALYIACGVTKQECIEDLDRRNIEVMADHVLIINKMYNEISQADAFNEITSIYDNLKPIAEEKPEEIDQICFDALLNMDFSKNKNDLN